MKLHRAFAVLCLIAASMSVFAPSAHAATAAAMAADSQAVVAAAAPTTEALASLRTSLAAARRVRVTLASGQRAVSRAVADSTGLALETGGGHGIAEGELGAPIPWSDVIAIDVLPPGRDESRAHRFGSSMATGAVVGLGTGLVVSGIHARYWSDKEEAWLWMPFGFVLGTVAGAVVGAGRAVLARPSAVGWTRVYEAPR